MTVRVIAVDDETLALKGLEHVVRDMEDVILVGTARGTADARLLIESARPDVALLDNHMRGGSGLDLAKDLIGEEGPAVVFVTAFDRYAARAFDLAAADYVLKPAEPARLQQAIQKAKRRLQERHSAERIEELKQVIEAIRDHGSLPDEPDDALDLWVRKNGSDFTRIRSEDIDSVEAEGDYVRIFAHGRSYLHRTSIVSLSQELEPSSFVRIHRAALVRFERIAEVHRTSFGLSGVTLRDGRHLKVGRVYARELKKRLNAARARERLH